MIRCFDPRFLTKDARVPREPGGAQLFDKNLWLFQNPCQRSFNVNFLQPEARRIFRSGVFGLFVFGLLAFVFGLLVFVFGLLTFVFGLLAFVSRLFVCGSQLMAFFVYGFQLSGFWLPAFFFPVPSKKCKYL